MDYVQAFFPGFFNKEQQFEEDQNEIQYQHTDEEQNYVDTNIGKAVSGHFNMDTGLWEYKSLSQHKPKEMYDPLLVNNTQQRNDFIRSGNLDSTPGFYSHFILSPQHVDSRLKFVNVAFHFLMKISTKLNRELEPSSPEMGLLLSNIIIFNAHRKCAK